MAVGAIAIYRAAVLLVIHALNGPACLVRAELFGVCGAMRLRSTGSCAAVRWRFGESRGAIRSAGSWVRSGAWAWGGTEDAIASARQLSCSSALLAVSEERD